MNERDFLGIGPLKDEQIGMHTQKIGLTPIAY